MARPHDMPGPERWPHGVRARYVCGCRCEACRAANTAYYHQRQARLKALATDVTPQLTPWGRRCRGIGSGRDREHCWTMLRKDSTGGLCAACREKLAAGQLVRATRAKRRLRTLSRKGIGYKSVAAASDVGKTLIAWILSGRKTWIRRSTEQRILAVTAAAIADSAFVPAARTWKLVERLRRDHGFSKAELARRLGYKSPALQLGRERVTARNELRIKRFYRQAVT